MISDYLRITSPSPVPERHIIEEKESPVAGKEQPAQPLTYYHQQVLKFREEMLSKEYLYQQVIHARLFIDRNYAGKIGLKDIAGEAFFSKFHFIRVFKNIYGQTPYQYLKMVRIEKAKQLLQKGRPVTDVCFSVGFDSVTSFTAFFKKINGRTPSAFQKSKRNPQNCKSL